MGRKQCRICLQPDNDDLISVQLVQDQVTIADMILVITGVSVTSDRRLPQNICLVCLERLKEAHNLRQRCIESDANLRAALSSPCIDYLQEELDENTRSDSQTIDEGSEPEKSEFLEILDISDQRPDDVQTCKSDPTDEEITTPEQNEESEQYTESARFDSPVPWQEHVHYRPVEAECFPCCGCTLSFGSEHELKVHSVRVHRKSKYRSKFHPLQCTVCYQTFLSRKYMELHTKAATGKQTRAMLQCISCNALQSERKSMCDHLEQHHSQWKNVTESNQMLEHHEEEMLDELESVTGDVPRSTAGEEVKMEMQNDSKDEEDHDGDHFSEESAASEEEEEMTDEEYVIEVDFAEESVMEEDEIDKSALEKHEDDYREAPTPDEDEEHEESTSSKGQRMHTDKLMCRIPANTVRVVSDEECYAIVELIQERCCCCAEFFKTPERLEKHLAEKRQAMDTGAEAGGNTSPKYTCEYCGMQFKYPVLYVVHKRVREQRQFYMCRLCKRLLDSEARMKSHMLHTEEHAQFFKLLRENVTDRYESLTLPGERCCSCRKYFDSHTEMLEHFRQTHALEAEQRGAQKSNLPYACDTCKRRYSRQQYLERHLEQASNALQYFCKLCDFQTRSQKRIELHLYSGIHRKEMPSLALQPLETYAKLPPLRYCCFVNCKLHFRDVDALHQHVREAHEKKLLWNKRHAQSMRTGGAEGDYLECDACGQLFRNITALKTHQSQSSQPNCVCSICGVKKRSRMALLEHERTHTGERPYGCDYCDKTFGARTTLLSHMKCHTPREYQCGTCKVMFARLENLKRHIRLLHSEASCQCAMCPKKFKTRENLVAHTRTHTGEKPYQCRTESCGKRYVNIGDRRRHEMAVHTLERPHKCSHCDKAFVRPRQLVIHERRHTGEKPFVCELCGKAFYEKSNLSKHLCKAAA